MMHHIRKTIMDELATAEYRRYGELKPKNLDGNVFTYHLKGLLTDKLVAKTNEGTYTLTTKGRDYIVHRHEDTELSAHSIFLIVINRQSKYLLRRRMVQPLLNYAGFVHGEPVAGGNIIEDAKHRLYAKTGLKNISLSVAGSALISQYYKDELQSYSNAIILYGDTERDLVVEDDSTGHNFWATLDTVNSLLPSCIDIASMINAKQPWLEKTYTLS